jgi:hypothetical protein
MILFFLTESDSFYFLVLILYFSLGGLISFSLLGVVLAIMSLCLARKNDAKLTEIALGYVRAAIPLVS